MNASSWHRYRVGDRIFKILPPNQFRDEPVVVDLPKFISIDSNAFSPSVSLKRNIDGDFKIRARWRYENKNYWIDSGALLFRRSSVLRRRRPEHGHVEVERSEIEAYP